MEVIGDPWPPSPAQKPAGALLGKRSNGASSNPRRGTGSEAKGIRSAG